MTSSPTPLPTGEAAAGRRPLTRLEDLARNGLIDAEAVEALQPVIERFQLRLTPSLASRIDATDPNDPIARQFVPGTAELDLQPEELTDPIGDEVHAQGPGIIHRYPDRVLLKPTHLCQVYCRFCFRREVVGDGSATLDDADLDAALGYIAGNPEIFEVILTGGDPLVLSDRRLERILSALEAIPHVAVVRLHTRAIIADPARVTPEFVRLLRRRFATWIALHVNHLTELDDAVTGAIARLVDGGVPMVSQTVLLQGVNDDTATLAALMRGLVARRVKPYYLHHLDLAAGTSHFRTSVANGRAIVRELRGHVTGLAQPTYVLDIPGGFGKVPLEGGWVEPTTTPGDYQITDWQGNTHRYTDPAGKP